MMDFVAIDFETATSGANSIYSMGICTVSGGKIKERKELLIRPEPFEFNEYNIKIHNITPDMVIDKPTFKEYWNEIFPTIRASVTPAIVSREIFALDSVASNAMKSSNPNSGVHPVDVAKTVDTSNPDPGKNQGGIAVVECFNVSFCDANGVRKDRPNGGLYVTEAEASKTVTAGGPNAETVVIALDGDK
ncbi:MAG: hypothetical protein IKK18_02070, partial [Clostridia bacterium]|nr:hypothetical protein [Clostridia bacterium]